MFAVTFGLLAAARASDPSAADARAALEKWFSQAAKVKTVQADFEQLRRLKSLTRALRKPGKLWMEKDSGLFRWQVGDPPAMIVLRGKDGTMQVMDAKQKEARVWSREALEAEEKQGKGQGFAMLHSLQGGTLEGFDRDFELAAWKQDAANPAVWHFDWKFRDGKIASMVTKLEITANTADGAMLEFTLHMRDGSSLGTAIRNYTLNQPIPADTFQVDTAGWKTEVIEPKP